MIRIFGRSVLAAGLVAAIASVGAGQANASFIATFTGQTGGAFNYSLNFAATPTGTAAGTSEELVTGNSVTIFDFNPGSSAMPVVTLTGLAAANFTVSEALTSSPAPGTVPLTGDDPNLYNIIFTYNGALGSPLMTSTSFTGVSIASSLTGQMFGSTTGTDQKPNGTSVGTSANVVVPTAAVPEPASVVLMGIGGVIGLAACRKSRKATA